MATVRGGPVLAHVQAFADAVVKACQLSHDNPGTYPGHQPTREQALDIFVSNNEAGRVKGESICSFALANAERFGVRYVIFRGPEKGIWHRLDPVWRRMANRGSVTKNHYDHIHISFEATAQPSQSPSSTPTPQEDPEMLIAWITENNNRTEYLVTGQGKVWLDDQADVDNLKAAGVRYVPGESSWLARVPVA